MEYKPPSLHPPAQLSLAPLCNNKYMSCKILKASLDQPTQTLKIQHGASSVADSAPSASAASGDASGTAGAAPRPATLDSGGIERQRLQSMVLLFHEKLQSLFEQNEKIAELKSSHQNFIQKALYSAQQQNPFGVGGQPRGPAQSYQGYGGGGGYAAANSGYSGGQSQSQYGGPQGGQGQTPYYQNRTHRQ